MSRFTPKNPGWDARVRDSFARQGAMAFIGARLAALSPGHAEIELDRRPEVTQQHGFIHGGIIGMIADNAGGYAGFTLMPADASVLTVEYKLNLLAPADGAKAIARARVIKPGRTLFVVHVDVFVQRDGAEHLCATALQTLMVMTGMSDHAKS